MRELREKISKILIKWNMPTRQAAISEIVQLIQHEKQEECLCNKYAYSHKVTDDHRLKTIPIHKLSSCCNAPLKRVIVGGYDVCTNCSNL